MGELLHRQAQELLRRMVGEAEPVVRIQQHHRDRQGAEHGHRVDFGHFRLRIIGKAAQPTPRDDPDHAARASGACMRRS